MVEVSVGSATVDTGCAAFGHPLIDGCNRQRDSARSGALGSRGVSLLLDTFSRLAHALHVRAVRGPQLLRVLQSVLVVVALGARRMIEYPATCALVVAGLAVREPSILAGLVARKLVERLRGLAFGARLHTISITEKYNTATLDGWRVFRVTPKQVADGSALTLIEQAIKGVR